MSTASNKDQTGAISTGAKPSKRSKQAVPLPLMVFACKPSDVFPKIGGKQ